MRASGHIANVKACLVMIMATKPGDPMACMGVESFQRGCLETKSPKIEGLQGQWVYLFSSKLHIARQTP